MKKSVGVMLCICLLSGPVSGCGAEESNLTDDSNITTVEESSEPETDDTAVSGNDQSLVTQESAGEIEPPMEETGWKQAYLAKAEEIEAKYSSHSSIEYDLIYLDDDDIPELVAGSTESWFILYTWKDGKVYELSEEEFSSYKKESLPEIYGRLNLEALRFLLGNTDDPSAFFSDSGNMEDEAVSSLLVTETYYDMDYPITYQYQTEYEYDSAGNQIRVLSYHEDGTYSEYEFKYKYDDTGNLIEMISCEDGVIIGHEKYEYDEDGRIKSLVYVGERSKNVSVYQYDYYGNMTMEVIYSFYGEIFNKNCFLYEYDKDGNLIKETHYRYDIFIGISEYMYDDSDNLIREVFYDTEGDSIWFRGYEYDKNGNIIEETTLSHINKYEYDEQNNKTKEISYLADGSSMRYYSEFTYEWR